MGHACMSRAATGVALGVSDRPRLLHHRPIYTTAVVVLSTSEQIWPEEFQKAKNGWRLPLFGLLLGGLGGGLEGRRRPWLAGSCW